MIKPTYLLMLGCLSGASLAPAQTCSLATMKGDWGINMSGTRSSGPGGPLEQAVGSLIRTYDGAGGFTQIDNIHGAVSGHVPNRQGRGTYTINPDCTGVAKLEIPGVAFQPEERFVIVENGNVTLMATTSPATLHIIAQGRRVVTTDAAARAAQADALAQLVRLVNAIAFRMGISASAN